MNKSIIFLFLIVLVILIASCSDVETPTGDVINVPNGEAEIEQAQETQQAEEVREEKPTCTDECSSSSCDEFTYTSCLSGKDGCKYRYNEGIVKGKCGVVCKKDSDCEDNEECDDYKCKQTTYPMNQGIRVDYLTYKITKAQTFTKMGTSLIKKETTGKFVKVYFSITNNAKETKQIFTPRFKLVDSLDRKFDRLSDDMMYIADYLEFGKQLQPSLTVSGAIVFELPKDSKNLKLEIRGDWLSTTKVTVILSNIQNIGIDTTLKDKTNEMMDDLM